MLYAGYLRFSNKSMYHKWVCSRYYKSIDINYITTFYLYAAHTFKMMNNEKIVHLHPIIKTTNA